ncbi:hypothetical protein [Microbacterium sp. NPDC079995]|uniref:hypothetical protein n=1 Tax=unclassified Microbacterium TaxID=2609290 RepID=UPI00344C1D88
MTASQSTPAHNDHGLWTVVHEHVKTPTTRDGYLTVSLRDIGHIDSIAASGLMQQWARQAAFSLRGIRPRELVWLVMKDALFIADRELGLNGALNDNVLAILAGTYKGELPKFTVGMHSFFVQSRIAAWFDRARPNPWETLVAVSKRMT